MITIAFFNNKGGVGKTSLVYHLAWMYADLGVSTVAVDIDPQANLSTMFLEEERLEALWPDGEHPQSILGAVSPILRGTGDISEPHVEPITSNLGVVVGDLGLSRFEAKLSSAWPACLDRDEAAFRIESAFHRTILGAAELRDADLALIDVGPNLGAINRRRSLRRTSSSFLLLPIFSPFRGFATWDRLSGTGGLSGGIDWNAGRTMTPSHCRQPKSAPRAIS